MQQVEDLPIEVQQQAFGEILTLNCNESYALEDGSTSFTTICKSFEKDTDPNYEVKFNTDQSEWPKTCTSTNQSSRKKRQIIHIIGIILISTYEIYTERGQFLQPETRGILE